MNTLDIDVLSIVLCYLDMNKYNFLLQKLDLSSNEIQLLTNIWKKNCNYTITGSGKYKQYRRNGKYHQENDDIPAITTKCTCSKKDGGYMLAVQEWYKSGELFRHHNIRVIEWWYYGQDENWMIK